MATIVDLETGMTEYFLRQSTVTSKIGQRFYKTASQEWILCLESFMQERSPRTAQWISYRRSGQIVHRLAAGKESRMRFAGFELRCWGQVVEDAEALLEILIATIGQSYVGTWGTTTPVTIKNAHWTYEEQTTDYDEMFRQAYASVGLFVPYRSDL